MWFTLENMQGCESLHSSREPAAESSAERCSDGEQSVPSKLRSTPRSVLLQRQKDGILDKFPIWDDVRTFDGRPWRGKVDVISGGFPCQDISSAGRGLGIERGERSGLWREYARIIREVRPRYCFVENSPMLTVRGLGIVLGDLAALGYDAAWKVLSAGDCGAPHERARMWIVGRDDQVADAMQNGLQRRGKDGNIPRQIGLCCGTRTDEIECLSDATDKRDVRRLWRVGADGPTRPRGEDDGCGASSDWGRQWWKAEPGLGRVADGVANRVDRIKAIGNGQVPLVAARAFCELMEELGE